MGRGGVVAGGQAWTCPCWFAPPPPSPSSPCHLGSAFSMHRYPAYPAHFLTRSERALSGTCRRLNVPLLLAWSPVSRVAAEFSRAKVLTHGNILTLASEHTIWWKLESQTDVS